MSWKLVVLVCLACLSGERSVNVFPNRRFDESGAAPSRCLDQRFSLSCAINLALSVSVSLLKENDSELFDTIDAQKSGVFRLHC